MSGCSRDLCNPFNKPNLNEKLVQGHGKAMGSAGVPHSSRHSQGNTFQATPSTWVSASLQDPFTESDARFGFQNFPNKPFKLKETPNVFMEFRKSQKQALLESLTLQGPFNTLYLRHYSPFLWIIHQNDKSTARQVSNLPVKEVYILHRIYDDPPPIIYIL